MRPVRAGAVGAIICLLAAGAAQAGGMKHYKADDCLPSVEAWLLEGGVDLATVASINIDAETRQNSDGDKFFKGWQAWVRFTDRDGAVIFGMRPNCDLRSTWTRGGVTWTGPGA